MLENWTQLLIITVIGDVPLMFFNLSRVFLSLSCCGFNTCGRDWCKVDKQGQDRAELLISQQIITLSAIDV